MSMFLRWSRSWSTPTVSRTSFPLSLPWGSESPVIWEEQLQVKTEQEISCWVPQPPPFWSSLILHLIYWGIQFLLPSLSNQHTCGRKPLFFTSLAKLSSSCALAFLIPSLHSYAVSLCSSQDVCSCFHCLCISLLCFSFRKEVLTQPRWFSTFLSWVFEHWNQ